MQNKKHQSFSETMPWVALALVSVLSMTSTIMLTSNFSREIEGYINPSTQLLVSEKTGRAWIEIEFGDKQKRLFESTMGPSNYPLAQVLAEIAKTAGFSLNIREGQIREIAGISTATGSWNIYRYDMPTHQPIDRLDISGNDYYRIKFEQ